MSVERLEDAIRRRGENISSAEVEVEVTAPGAGVEPEALVRFLVPRMPHYMVPRYVRVLPELPRTETQRVQKAGLRREGVTPDTWGPRGCQ
ncbi:MAG TPA: hypothetical protein VEA40_14910 [Ramlibacter sp.]|nr:hypothetical protein [Ramlibacter sp.]